MIQNILFQVVIFLTNIIQCITGFAGTVLAMPFSVMLVGYEVSKAVLNILGMLASVYIVVTAFKSINRKEFLKTGGVMIAGMIAGFAVKKYVLDRFDPGVLYKILGVLVIGFAIFSAVKFYMKKEDRELPPYIAYPLLVAAGVAHGIFVCGGPLLVVYANGKLKDTDEFRATLSAVWVLLNGVNFALDIYSGYFTASTVKITAISIVSLALALVIGNLIYKKLSRRVFLQLTYLLMFISGVSLLIK